MGRRNDNTSFFGLNQKTAKDLLTIFPKGGDGKCKPCIDVTITSPPYWNLKNYGFEGQIGYGQSYDEYLESLEKIFGDVYNITRDTGSLWIIADTFKKKKSDCSSRNVKDGEIVLLPFDVTERLRKSGWRLQDIFIWEKDKTLPWSRKGQLRNIFEYVLFFTKSSNFKFNVDRIRVADCDKLKEWWVKYPERYNPKGATPSDIWKYSIPVQGSWANGFIRHFCPFPLALVEKIIMLTTDRGDTVLDPFAGSGVVLGVAHSMNRRYVGFELKSEYVKMFNNHVLKEIAEGMNGRKETWRKRQKAQLHLMQTIRNLRLTKYPKTLARQLRLEDSASEADLQINAIFAIERKTGSLGLKDCGRWKFLKEDIYLLLETLRNNEELQRTVSRISQRPPLSKFGIESKFFFKQRDAFIKKEMRDPSFDHKHLWMYAKGKMNAFCMKLDFSKWVILSRQDDWKQYAGNVIPPVISNVRVNQPVIKNGFRENRVDH
jgi:DNA modification methylase